MDRATIVVYESDGVLVYTCIDVNAGTITPNERIVPADEQWTAFWKAMETLDI